MIHTCDFIGRAVIVHGVKYWVRETDLRVYVWNKSARAYIQSYDNQDSVYSQVIEAAKGVGQTWL